MRSLFLLTILSLPLAALNLQESEQQALSANVAIQLTEQDVSQNNYRHLQSILSWMPNLTFGSMYAALQKPQNISHMQRQTQLFNNQLVLTQPIYSSELLGDLKLSKIAKQGAIAGREMAINDTLFQVRVLYLDVLYTQKAVEVEQQVIGYMNTAYQDQQKKFESGSGRTLAVSEAKSALSQEITKYYTAVKAASDAKQQFVLTIHLDPTKIQGLKLDDSIGIKDYPILMQKLTALQSIIGGEIAQPASLNTPNSRKTPSVSPPSAVRAFSNEIGPSIQPCIKIGVTRSPTFHFVTSLPTAVTSPAPSENGTSGIFSFGLYRPSTIIKSR